jgi:hypothetical protein
MHRMSRTGDRRVRARGRELARAALLAACLLAAAQPASAADTDLVLLRNGDRLSGEIKQLQYGRLELSTLSIGTIYVEWDKVVALVSPNYFEVETADGSRHYGNLQQGAAGTINVALGGSVEPLDVASVVRIRRIKSSFWERLDGSISLGASYTKSSDIGQGSLAVNLRTKRPAYEFSTDFSTTVTVQPDQPDQSRTMFSASYLRLSRNRWFVPATGRLERNTDLGLDLRSSTGGGIGRRFVQTNRSMFSGAAALMLNRENPVSGETTTNVEALIAASYEFFTYDTPKTTIDTIFSLYPSLTVSGRYRTEFSLTLNREIVKDFTVGVTGYDSYDNKPPAGSSSTHDFGISLTVGWTF